MPGLLSKLALEIGLGLDGESSEAVMTHIKTVARSLPTYGRAGIVRVKSDWSKRAEIDLKARRRAAMVIC